MTQIAKPLESCRDFPWFDFEKLIFKLSEQEETR